MWKSTRKKKRSVRDEKVKRERGAVRQKCNQSWRYTSRDSVRSGLLEWGFVTASIEAAAQEHRAHGRISSYMNDYMAL